MPLMFDWQTRRLLNSRARDRLGNRIEINNAMIAITTNNSINVNPRSLRITIPSPSKFDRMTQRLGYSCLLVPALPRSRLRPRDDSLPSNSHHGTPVAGQLTPPNESRNDATRTLLFANQNRRKERFVCLPVFPEAAFLLATLYRRS